MCIGTSLRLHRYFINSVQTQRLSSPQLSKVRSNTFHSIPYPMNEVNDRDSWKEVKRTALNISQTLLWKNAGEAVGWVPSIFWSIKSCLEDLPLLERSVAGPRGREVQSCFFKLFLFCLSAGKVPLVNQSTMVKDLNFICIRDRGREKPGEISQARPSKWLCPGF